MKMEIANETLDELLQIFRLTQPEDGHNTKTLTNCIDCYFSKFKGVRVDIKKVDSQFGPKGLLDSKNSYIKILDEKRDVSIKDVITGLVDDNHLIKEISTDKFKGKDYRRTFYKVRNPLDEIK